MEDTAPRNPYIPKPKGDKSIMYDGYEFTHRYLTAKHNSYRCKHFKRFQCTAKVSITLNKDKITVTSDHNIHCKLNMIELNMLTISEVEDT